MVNCTSVNYRFSTEKRNYSTLLSFGWDDTAQCFDQPIRPDLTLQLQILSLHWSSFQNVLKGSQIPKDLFQLFLIIHSTSSGTFPSMHWRALYTLHQLAYQSFSYLVRRLHFYIPTPNTGSEIQSKSGI